MDSVLLESEQTVNEVMQKRTAWVRSQARDVVRGDGPRASHSSIETDTKECISRNSL